MKLKNFLIESAYCLGMFVALWLTGHSRAAHAQVASDSTLGALNPANGLRVGESAKAWQWDATKWEWENSIFGWVTDSIKWVSTDTTFEGDCKCEHDWVLDVEKLGSIDIHFIFGFEVMDCTRLNPDGKHCNEHQSATREKICRKCLFSVIEREKWFQRYVAPPKSEFERLKEKQMDKR